MIFFFFFRFNTYFNFNLSFKYKTIETCPCIFATYLICISAVHMYIVSPKPKTLSFRNSNMLGFFNREASKRKLEVPTINAQSLSKEAEQNSIKISCFGCQANELSRGP